MPLFSDPVSDFRSYFEKLISAGAQRKWIPKKCPYPDSIKKFSSDWLNPICNVWNRAISDTLVIVRDRSHYRTDRTLLVNRRAKNWRVYVKLTPVNTVNVNCVFNVLIKRQCIKNVLGNERRKNFHKRYSCQHSKLISMPHGSKGRTHGRPLTRSQYCNGTAISVSAVTEYMSRFTSLNGG